MNEEKFYSPGNRVLGLIGTFLGVAAVVTIAIEGPSQSGWVAMFAIALVVTLCWAFLIRPQIQLTPETLTLRNPLVTHVVPIQLVDNVEVRRFTVVAVPEGRLTSTAVARGMIELARHDRGVAPGKTSLSRDQASLMTERIRARVDEASLIPPAGDAGVRRTPAWLEIALLVISGIGAVVALLV